MDHARKIGKSDKPMKWERSEGSRPSFCTNLIGRDPPIVEDNQFVNWKKWLADRKRVRNRIKSVTGRQSAKHLMDSCEIVRPQIEMQNLMDYATVPAPVIPDKFRGGPEFWKIPEPLRQKDPCATPVTLTLSKKELNVMPDLTYVGLPEVIKEEKDLVDLRDDGIWKQSEYLEKRRTELKDEIEVLQLKEPELEKLAIEGKAPKPKPRMIRVPPITVSPPDSEDSSDESDLFIVLKIQDTELVWSRHMYDSGDQNPGPITWKLVFEGNVDECCQQTIRFENKGTRVIIYQWRPSNFQTRQFSVDQRFSPFYFNKSRELILPGQIVELKVCYLPRCPGTFSESWTLLTDVKISLSPLIFQFWGCASETGSASKEFDPQSIEDLLDQRVRDTVIREILEEIVSCTDCCPYPEPAYGSLFLEGDIFRTKNPSYHYHPSLIPEFRKLYRSVVDEQAPIWNLSLMDLRHILLKVTDSKFRNETLKQFNDLCKRALKPTLHPPLNNRKYEMIYAVLCSFVDQIEVESDFILNASRKMKENENSVSEVAKSEASWVSIKSSGSKVKRRSRKRSVSQDVVPESEQDKVKVKDKAYTEVLFVRVYQVLTETVERACAIIDSFNRLSTADK